LQRAAIAALALAFCASPLALGQIAAVAQTKAQAYKAPRTAFGQPDISGYWSNSTLTPETRASALGTRSVYTPEEVAKLESAVAAEVEEGNEPTDPNVRTEDLKRSANTRPEFAAAGGDVGGYNRGWLDPGSHVMRVGGEPRTSFITTANGQPPPRKPGAPAAPGFGGMGSFDSYETRSLGERCIIGFGRNAGPPMLPNGFYNNNYHFMQSPDAVVITVEMVHDARIIRLNSKHRTDGVRPWMGDSIGWWDGDTLVVETINIPQRQAYKGAWKELKVTERFTRKGKGRLHYQFTVSDPTIWDTAWGGEYEFSPLQGQIYEYACHEGNYALPGILAGARVEEADAKKAKAGGGAP
jgi:hypothetical protein